MSERRREAPDETRRPWTCTAEAGCPAEFTGVVPSAEAERGRGGCGGGACGPVTPTGSDDVRDIGAREGVHDDALMELACDECEASTDEADSLMELACDDSSATADDAETNDELGVGVVGGESALEAASGGGAVAACVSCLRRYEARRAGAKSGMRGDCSTPDELLRLPPPLLISRRNEDILAPCAQQIWSRW